MTKLTIDLDEGVLERARSRASQQGVSLDSLLQSYLETYARDGLSSRQAVESLLDLSRKTTSGSGGRRWTRDELHAR